MNAPAIVVLLTQAVVVGWFVLLGAWAGPLARRTVGPLGALRVALWTGLATALVIVLGTGLVAPLRGPAAIVVAGLVTVGAAVAWLLVRRRTGPGARSGPVITRSAWVIAPVAALGLLAFVIAHLAFGPVANYDTGLYHLNAIQYAQDYPTIHGLANLHTRLGTNVSAFNLAAFLTNTPWGPDAFRLLVGVFWLALVADVVLRLLDGRGRPWRSPGTYVLLLGLAVSVPALLGLADYRVTSPSPDTLALIATLAAGAYLVDALHARSGVWAAVSVVTAALAASLRTQLWVLAAATVVVLVLHWLRHRRPDRADRWSGPTSLVVGSGLLSAVLLVLLMVRDALLSGWLLFPATYLPMPVAWRVPEAAARSTRDWILSWARDPAAGPDQTMGSWYWFGPWLRQSVVEWSIAGAIGLAGLALVVWLAARRIPVSGRRTAALGVVPAAATVAVWFLTAPDPRFAWGPILLLGAIPAAFALTRLAARAPTGESRLGAPVHDSEGAVPILAGGLLTLAVLPAAIAGLIAIRGAPAGDFQLRTYSFGPVPVVAAVATLPRPATTPFDLADGNHVLIPVDTDQCWEVFPACSPYRDSSLRFLGPTVADGFASGP